MIGIDKISLSTTDFKVKNITDIGKFGRNHNIKQGGSDAMQIYSDLEGHTIECNSVYSNQKIGHYDISNKKGLQIHFNPSKVFHHYNLTNTGEDLNTCIDAVKSEIKDLGIMVNFDEMNLIRLDIAKQQSMNLPLIAYHSAYGLIKGKRTETIKMPNGHYIGNKTHETCFYGKQNELIYNQKLVEYKAENSMPKNLLRIEPRFKKTDAVRRYTKLNNIKELQSITPNEVNSIYNKFLKRIFFETKNNGNQISLDFNTEIGFFKMLKEKNSRSYFNHWLQIHSVFDLLEKFGSYDMLTEFFIQAGESRKSILMFITKIKTLVAEYHILSNELKLNTKVTPITMLEELKEKFVA